MKYKPAESKRLSEPQVKETLKTKKRNYTKEKYHNKIVQRQR